MPAGPPVHDAFFPGVKRRAWSSAEIRGAAGPVIVILVDALQAAHLSTYGYERPTAPAVDRLANEGVLFTQAIAASCWTRPTVATVMTGKPLAEHRMEDAGARLDPSYVTLAEAFHAAGRPTAAFVANPIVRSLYGYDQGFDTYMDSDDLGRRTPAIGVLEPATAWVREHARDDFLLWVFLTDPHDPYQPNAATAGMFTEEPGEFPVQPPPQVARPFPAPVQARIIAAYDESIRYASDEIVTFFDELRRLGVYDRATIVFSADHGEMLGEHGSWRHLYQLWEPAIRIPLVIRSPAIPAALRGTAETRLVAQTSLMPTLLELSGLSSPEGVRGRSILPMLGDRAGRSESWAVSEFALFGAHRRAVQDGEMKVVEYHAVDAARFLAATGHSADRIPHAPREGVKVEVYDLASDPGETNDLAAHGVPERARRLLESAGPIAATPGAAPDEDLMRDLRALGYAN